MSRHPLMRILKDVGYCPFYVEKFVFDNSINYNVNGGRSRTSTFRLSQSRIGFPQASVK
jgi:hypothetical protein